MRYSGQVNGLVHDMESKGKSDAGRLFSWQDIPWLGAPRGPWLPAGRPRSCEVDRPSSMTPQFYPDQSIPLDRNSFLGPNRHE
jgi:hypothetical protein